MTTPADRGESTTSMEPLLVGESSRWRSALHDKALELVAASTRLDQSLPKGSAAGLADLVRSMNCYYSNLIEGHDTHPVDIERALQADYSNEPRKRDLQLEARSHIAVQSWIDSGGLKARAATADGVREIHRRFCEDLPESLLTVENPDTGTHHRVVPGRWRESDVAVGRHHAVSPGAVSRFMDRFEAVYARLGKLHHPRGGGCSPSADLDSSVRRRKWPRRKTDVIRDAPGFHGHERNLVDSPRTRPQ